MNFTVIWTVTAQEQLAALWVAAADRAAVAAASHRIETLIRNDPLEAGESRGDTHRLVMDPPLSVLYTIDESRQVAHVASVGFSRRPRS